ncbi:hypothetical protein M405DRAFT_532335 [Rhizopogon salebrosus TDB-379]|nr:hypothetical protein M405DRAFT_532335 [Rhizopogon salebrosus TDB-379]
MKAFDTAGLFDKEKWESGSRLGQERALPIGWGVVGEGQVQCWVGIASSRNSNFSDETSSIMIVDCRSVEMSETMTIQRPTTTPCCLTTSHRTRHFQTLWVRLLLIGGAHALRGTLV